MAQKLQNVTDNMPTTVGARPTMKKTILATAASSALPRPGATTAEFPSKPTRVARVDYNF